MAFFRTIWKTNSKHKKLSEDLVLQSLKEGDVDQTSTIDIEDEIVTFKLKYLGSTVVEKVSGENISVEAVKNIMKTAKANKGRKKLQRVNVNISLKGISVTDSQGTDILKISIYRISNCSTDPTHRQIFSFISTDSTETMECHAFICSKRKVAETVTLAVAHAFSTAYEAWKILPGGKEFGKDLPDGKVFGKELYGEKELDSGKDLTSGKEQKENEKNQLNHLPKPSGKSEEIIQEEKLIDFDSEPCGEEDFFGQQDVTSHWVCFDDDFLSETPTKTTFKEVDLIFA
nr:unnamed protein product [Callosobruchus chinensis]